MFALSGGNGIKRNVTSLGQNNQSNNALSPVGQMGGAKEASRLKEIRVRIKGVKSIEKITKTMKMIASSRLRASQTRMEKNKSFFSGIQKIMSLFPPQQSEKNLIMPFSADRGLCGAINSSIIKGTRNLLNERSKSNPTAEFKLVTFGDKCVQVLSKDNANKLTFHVGESSKKPFSFAGASVIAERIVNEIPFDSLSIFHNYFISAVSYGQKMIEISAPSQMQERNEVYNYEFEEDDRLFQITDLVEFEIASSIYNAYCETSAAELAARMASMDSATRNAQEMLKNLNTAYNRGRQAAITTELTEIISGAAAVQ